VLLRRAGNLAVALALVAGACTGGDGEEGGTGPTVPRPPQRGGTLRVGVGPLGTLDPAQARTVDQLMVADQLFDTLTTFDARTGEAAPALAARWQASPDLRQWDFFLRPGARFSSERAVTAEDVKYTLERIAKPGSGSPGTDLMSAVAAVTAPAPDTVHLELKQPWSVLPLVLSSPVFGVVAKEAVEAQPPAPPFADRPVGSGPFRVADRNDDVLALLPGPGSPALVAGIEFVQAPDVASVYRLFTEGKLDMAQVPPQDVESAARRYGRGAFRPYLAELFYGFNLKSPKLADIRFREAIVRGIDRRAIVRAVYGTTVTAADGIVVEGLSAHQPDPCGERCRYDPARARALLAEAFGSSPAPEVQLAFDEDEAQQAVAKAIEVALGEIGIKVVLAPKSLKDYKDYAVSGQQELFRLGWIARYPSADDFLPPLFMTGSPNNLTGFSVPAVDEQLRTARSEADPAKRAELYRAAERAIMDVLPVVPVAQFRLHAVLSRRVRALDLTTAGTFDGSVVWLARD
jgi:oligopeptide transport system substrate-binding protein